MIYLVIISSNLAFFLSLGLARTQDSVTSATLVARRARMLDVDGFVGQGGFCATSRIRCALYYPLGDGVLWVFMPIGGVSLAE